MGKEVVRRLRFILGARGFFPSKTEPDLWAAGRGGPLPISSFKPWIDE